MQIKTKSKKNEARNGGTDLAKQGFSEYVYNYTKTKRVFCLLALTKQTIQSFITKLFLK